MKRFGWSVALATAFGLAVSIWAIGLAGWHDMLGSVARMRWRGFLLFASTTAPVLTVLGAAWASATRAGPPRPLWTFVWARAVREAANDLLPFSQIGGLVLGMRALTSAGIGPTRVYAATIVDLTTEMMAQFVLTVLGLWVLGGLLVGSGSPARLQALAWSGVAGMALLTLAFALLQRPALRLAAALGGRMLPGLRLSIDAVHAELVAFGQARWAMLIPFLWNLGAWLLSILSAWLALHLLGAPLALVRVIALEVMIFALRSSAFLVPAAIGVQEAGYVLLGPLLGLDRDSALALSLVKRARDVGFAIPILLILQWREARGLRAADRPG